METSASLNWLLDKADAAWSVGDGARAYVLAEQVLAMEEGPSPTHRRALILSALAALATDRPELAAKRFRDAVRAYPAPPDPELYAGLGDALLACQQPDAAAAAWRTALSIHPRHGGAHAGLGALMVSQGRLERAEEHMSVAVTALPEPAAALSNLGVIQRRLGKIEAAEFHQRTAVDVDPDQPLYRFNLAGVLLAQGKWAEGFADWEARLSQPGWIAKPLAIPIWPPGDPIPSGRTVLIRAEQGAGDMIQMLRYAAPLAEAGVRLVAEAPPGMQRLMAAQPALSAVYPYPIDATERSGQRVGLEEMGIDLVLPAFSIPHRLLSTGIVEDPFPTAGSGGPGYLQTSTAPPTGFVHWRDRDDRPIIGLCWSGNPTFSENAIRSLSLEALEPVLAACCGRVRWVSVQKGPTADSIVAVRERLGLTAADLFDAGAVIEDWSDTAAILTGCLGVVSSDTGVAHLSGALGCATAVLLAAHCDWRWGVTGQESRWYPSARLLRQDKLGVWDDPIAELPSLLGQWLDGQLHPQ